MPEYSRDNAACSVFTFKDGLLSKIAHDLELEVTRFELNVDLAGPSVTAEFDPASLRVLTAMRDGAPDPSALSSSDKEKIAATIQSDVLDVRQHPIIRFNSTRVSRRADGGYDVSGALELHGVKRSIEVSTRLEGGRQVARVELQQPDYGITPYKAMMGTLKLKPYVRVQISIPAS